MSRVFVGVGNGRNGTRGIRESDSRHAGTGGHNVYVEQGGQSYHLTRRVRRARQGYSWDGVGPNSTELARAILWLVTGEEPPWSLYKGFASDVVAHFPAPTGCDGECWRLREDEVRAWLRDVGWPR